METIKNYTDIEQSKKLAEILSFESADMYYAKHSLENYYCPIPFIGKYSEIHGQIPCWSLSALLNILPDPAIVKRNNKYRCHILIQNTCYISDTTDNPIDTCYKIILRLHKENLL